MSLVGTRPPLISETNLYELHHKARLELAEDYLKNPKEKEINSEINVLWSALNMGAGDRRIRIIQWNDSWLISVLHKALVGL